MAQRSCYHHRRHYHHHQTGQRELADVGSSLEWAAHASGTPSVMGQRWTQIHQYILWMERQSELWAGVSLLTTEPLVSYVHPQNALRKWSNFCVSVGELNHNARLPGHSPRPNLPPSSFFSSLLSFTPAALCRAGEETKPRHILNKCSTAPPPPQPQHLRIQIGCELISSLISSSYNHYNAF